jgi:hypothetical protein
MNTNLKSDSRIDTIEFTCEHGRSSDVTRAKDEVETHLRPAEDKEDVRFVSELGWLTAASVTIASIAQVVAIS